MCYTLVYYTGTHVITNANVRNSNLEEANVFGMYALYILLLTHVANSITYLHYYYVSIISVVFFNTQLVCFNNNTINI